MTEMSDVERLLRSALVPVEPSEALSDRLEIVTVPGGHLLYWDAYDAIADAVHRFLR